MTKIFKQLVEEFGYIAEADPAELIRQQPAMSYAANHLSGQGAQPVPAGDPSPMKPGETRYNPDYDPTTGKLKTDTDQNPDDQKTDPDKPKPKPGNKGANPGTRAWQHWLNAHGAKITVDGIPGPQTDTATKMVWEKLFANSPTKAGPEKYNNFEQYKKLGAQWNQLRDEYQEMNGVGNAYNVKPSPGTTYVWLGSPKYLEIMKKYGFDPKTGDPIPGFKNPNDALWPTFLKGGTPGQSGQRKPGAANPKQEALILKSVERLEGLFKKYGVQAECAYKKDGSLLTEDDWVLKHIDMFTPQEQMEIWKVLSEAELTPFGTVGADIAARRRAGELDQRIATAQARMADRAAQNAPQQQSALGKFGRNLGSRFGLGGGKRAAIKGAAKLGLRAVPFLGTALLLWDVGSALYDTFATTELADLDPADQQIIAQEIKNLTQMSKSADYDSVSDETKKRVTAILNAANKLAQQQAA